MGRWQIEVEVTPTVNVCAPSDLKARELATGAVEAVLSQISAMTGLAMCVKVTRVKEGFTPEDEPVVHFDGCGCEGER